jgi:two-component system nitrogen regulation response regulator NtrX
MPRETQNKILRVLVDQTFQRVGGSTKVTVDVRIVSSTSRNIEADIAAGKFREDLYHRLSVVPIRVPPLADAEFVGMERSALHRKLKALGID